MEAEACARSRIRKRKIEVKLWYPVVLTSRRLQAPMQEAPRKAVWPAHCKMLSTSENRESAEVMTRKTTTTIGERLVLGGIVQVFQDTNGFCAFLRALSILFLGPAFYLKVWFECQQKRGNALCI